MSDSLPPVAPALDEPLEMLGACHDRIEAQLRTLERLLDYLPAHGADTPARGAARAVLRYFDLAGPNHHEDEERDLFPVLAARAAPAEAASVRALIRDLLDDHARMALALAVVRDGLAPIAAGAAAELDEAAVRRLASLYRRPLARMQGAPPARDFRQKIKIIFDGTNPRKSLLFHIRARTPYN